MAQLTKDWNHIPAGTEIALVGDGEASGDAVRVDGVRLTQLASDGFFAEPKRRKREKTEDPEAASTEEEI